MTSTGATSARPSDRPSASERAIRRIQEMLVDGRLHAGERIPSERSLSHALGVSRPTMREAIRALVAMNILETRRGSGTYVTSLRMADLVRPLRFAVAISTTGLAELWEVRLILEPEAAAAAARNATPDELATIEAEVGLTREHLSHARWSEVDLDVHTRIVEASHNSLLLNIHESLRALSIESRAVTARSARVRALGARDHERIAAALRARDAEAAREAMRAHLLGIEELTREAAPADRRERAAPG